MEPAVHAVGATDTVLDVVRLTAVDRMRPCADHAREIIGMNGFAERPPFELLQASAEIIQDLLVCELDPARSRHRCDEARNGFADQAVIMAELWFH